MLCVRAWKSWHSLILISVYTLPQFVLVFHFENGRAPSGNWASCETLLLWHIEKCLCCLCMDSASQRHWRLVQDKPNKSPYPCSSYLKYDYFSWMNAESLILSGEVNCSIKSFHGHFRCPFQTYHEWLRGGFMAWWLCTHFQVEADPVSQQKGGVEIAACLTSLRLMKDKSDHLVASDLTGTSG